MTESVVQYSLPDVFYGVVELQPAIVPTYQRVALYIYLFDEHTVNVYRLYFFLSVRRSEPDIHRLA